MRTMHEHTLSNSHRYTHSCTITQNIDRWACRPTGIPPSSSLPPAPQGLTVLFCKQQEPCIDRANHWRQELSLRHSLFLSLSLAHTRTHTHRMIDTQWQWIYAATPLLCLLFAFSPCWKDKQGGWCVCVCVCMHDVHMFVCAHAVGGSG